MFQVSRERHTKGLTMSTAAKLYCEINRNHANTDASFIANVILSCSKPTTRLKTLLHHVREGRHFSCLSFRMPYEGFFVDGVAVKFDFLLSPKNRVEDFRLTA